MALNVTSRLGFFDKQPMEVNKLIFEHGKLYSGGEDGRIVAWSHDLCNGSEIQAHSCPILGLASSRESMFSCSKDGNVKEYALDPLKFKDVVHRENHTEFWTMKYHDGILYVADDQGNVLMFKNDKVLGSINLAEPVKHMAISQNLLFTSKDNDVIVSELQLGGAKPMSKVIATLQGRGPLAVINDKLIFFDRNGKDLLLSSIVTASGHKQIKDAVKVAGAHEKIANAIVAGQMNNKFMVLTGGLDKTVKVWTLGDGNLKPMGSLNVDIAVNAIAIGENNMVYAAGGEGDIVAIKIAA